jgi:hypothetical protein
MATFPAIHVRAEDTPVARRRTTVRARIGGVAILALAMLGLVVTGLTHASAAAPRPTPHPTPTTAPRSPQATPSPAPRTLQPLPVVVVTPPPVVVPMATPRPVTRTTPFPAPRPLPSPGGVQGVQSTPPAVVPVPPPGILPPVASLPSPVRSLGAEPSSLAVIALGVFVAVLLGGTVMLTRRRL